MHLKPLVKLLLLLGALRIHLYTNIKLGEDSQLGPARVSIFRTFLITSLFGTLKSGHGAQNGWTAHVAKIAKIAWYTTEYRSGCVELKAQ